MGTGVALRQAGYFQCAIVDVRDLKRPCELGAIGRPSGTILPKGRVHDGVMLANR
jgi:hypothetical protein